MFMVNTSKEVVISDNPELYTVNVFRSRKNIIEMKKQASSLGDEFNGTVEISIDANGFDIPTESRRGNDVDCLSSKKLLLELRDKAGKVVYVRPLTKIKSIVNVPVISLVLAEKLKVYYG